MKKIKLVFLICILSIFIFPGSKIKKRYPVNDVDHSNPDEFAQSTKQTELSPATVDELKKLFPQPNDLKKIGLIYKWVTENFQGQKGGGKMIAKRSAQEIFDSKNITGCNDKGLLITSILRKFDFPVVFMNSAGINWAEKYKQNPRGPNMGHVFLEVYLKDKGKWIVIDSVTSEYIEDYDYNDLVIPIPKTRANQKAYFVYRKGKDHWTQGVRSNRDNAKVMKKFATTYPLETIVITKKEVKRLFKRRRKRMKM